MQAIARWTKLPETTFVLPPSSADCSYPLRMFAPHGEVRFAYHPSGGTAHAVLDAGLRNRATACWSSRGLPATCHCGWTCVMVAAASRSVPHARS